MSLIAAICSKYSANNFPSSEKIQHFPAMLKWTRAQFSSYGSFATFYSLFESSPWCNSVNMPLYTYHALRYLHM